MGNAGLVLKYIDKTRNRWSLRTDSFVRFWLIDIIICVQGDPLSSKRSHINVTFTPDPNWKNFQDPEIRKNDSDADRSSLGFGYPKFISHKELKDNNYLKNNTLFIKASVDTSRIIIK